MSLEEVLADSEGDDDLAHSASWRRYSQNLGGWQTRKSQEMITSIIERRKHVTELMSLASLNTVSTLDSPLRESQSPTSRQQDDAERITSGNPAILQMWLELEDEDDASDALVRRSRRSEIEGDDGLVESSAAWMRRSRILSRWTARQAQDMITTIERRNRMSELMALAGSTPDSSFLRESKSRTSRLSSSSLAILKMWRELEDENLLSLAKEKVWERLTQQRSVDSDTNISGTSKQRGARGVTSEEQFDGLNPQVDRVHDGSIADHEEGQPEHIRRDLLRLPEGQGLLDFLVRIETERKRELQDLSDRHTVSHCFHSHMFQSLLERRMLRNEKHLSSAEEEKPDHLQ